MAIQAKPTLKTIAQITGLGVSTVSRSLANAPEIKQSTKDRVRKVADEIGYRRNRAGVRLRTGKTYVISLVLPTESKALGNSSNFASGLSEALIGSPYHLIVTPHLTSEDPMDAIRYVVENETADAIVFTNTQPMDNRARYLLDRGLPFATHGQPGFKDTHCFYDFENRAFFKDGVTWLANAGVDSVILIPPPRHMAYAQDCLQGWAEGIGQSSCSGEILKDVTLDSSQEEIAAAMTSRLKNGKETIGFIATSADVGISCFEAARRAGIKIGKEIHVVSKESHGLVQRICPAIKTVEEDFQEAGKGLGNMLLKQLADPSALPQSWIETPRF